MRRDIRYQGAILRDHAILLIKHRVHTTGHSYWVIPGGGREDGETGEACVQREMREETNLDVEVVRLLLDEPCLLDDVYQRRHTYLCYCSSGDARPGYEPELHAAQHYAISEVGWFDLRDPATWDTQVFDDHITFPLLCRLQAALGYPVAPARPQT